MSQVAPRDNIMLHPNCYIHKRQELRSPDLRRPPTPTLRGPAALEPDTLHSLPLAPPRNAVVRQNKPEFLNLVEYLEL